MESTSTNQDLSIIGQKITYMVRKFPHHYARPLYRDAMASEKLVCFNYQLDLVNKVEALDDFFGKCGKKLEGFNASV